MAMVIPGYCGTCGVATESLPCWSCELEQRMAATERVAEL